MPGLPFPDYVYEDTRNPVEVKLLEFGRSVYHLFGITNFDLSKVRAIKNLRADQVFLIRGTVILSDRIGDEIGFEDLKPMLASEVAYNRVLRRGRDMEIASPNLVYALSVFALTLLGGAAFTALVGRVAPQLITSIIDVVAALSFFLPLASAILLGMRTPRRAILRADEMAEGVVGKGSLLSVLQKIEKQEVENGRHQGRNRLTAALSKRPSLDARIWNLSEARP